MVSIRKEVVLKHEDGDVSIKLVCPEESPLGKIWDAINAFRAAIYDQIQAQQDIVHKEEGEEECQPKESESSQEA